MGVCREEQMEREEKEVVREQWWAPLQRHRAGEEVGRLLEELGKETLPNERHSCEITMQFKFLPNLPSYS